MPSTNIITGYSSVHMGNTIFVFGGRLDYTSFHGAPDVYKYDIATDSWTQVTDLINPRYFSSAVQLSKNEILITSKFNFVYYM